MLEIKELSKSYGQVKALIDFSYVMKKGIYGILGTNGAGKSTLLNIITDNTVRDQGEILYDGEETRKLGKKFRRRVGYLPQQQGFYPQFTAREFLTYMGRLKGIGRKVIQEEVARRLEMVGLLEHADKKIGGYSGGMRQRVLLAQALLGEPDLIILDEPTAGLDPKERIRMRNFISAMGRDHTVLLATHVVSDIECIAREVLILNKGRLVKSGTPEVLIQEIEGLVKECYCTPEEMEQYQEQYGMGNIYQRQDGQVLRLVGENLPETFQSVPGNVNLEDVFLLYAN